MITVQANATIGNLIGSFGQLWETAEAACEGLVLTRSLTQNLLVVTDAEQAAAMHALVDDLLDRHPCRAIVVVVHAGECEVGGKLCGQIRKQRRTRAMVLEKLTLDTDWDHFPKLPNLIRPLLVNDITTSLFWATHLPTSLGRLTAIASMVDHTVVDSTLFNGDDWRSLEQIETHAPFDLAWLRLGPWRRTLAEAFEHFHWQADDPKTTITVEHGPHFGSLSASRCLQDWLVEHLGAVVQLDAKPGDGPTGEPWRLDLRYGPIHVQVRHLHAEPRLQAIVTLQDHCLLPTYCQATRGDRAQLLAAALDLA